MPAAEALPRRLLRPRPRQTPEGDTPHYRQRTRQGQRDPLPTIHSLARQENANNPTPPPETSCQSLAPQLGHFRVPPGMLLPQFGQYFLSTGAAVNVGCDPIEYEDLVDSPDLSSCEIAPSTVTFTMLAYRPTVAMRTLRKIPTKNAARKAAGFDATAAGLEITPARVPPVINTATIPATIAQTMLQRSMTMPLPKAKPHPTMNHVQIPVHT